MRSRTAPNPAEYQFERRVLGNDPQVRVWLQRLAGSRGVKSLPRRDIQFVLSEVVKRRQHDFRPDLVLDALKRTCPVLSYPEMTDVVEDLGHMFSQPEMVRFWARAQGTKNKKGPTPCFGWTKALMAILAMTGKTTHGTDAHDLLCNMPGLRRVFARADADGAALAEKERWDAAVHVESWQAVPDYTSLMRNIDRLTSTIRSEGIVANIAMLKALKRRYPEVGRRLLIDGTDVPAWVPQQWAERDSDRDKFLRRRVPEAGFRAYTHGPKQGKQALKGDEAGAQGRNLHVIKNWRGFYLVTLIDQATGLPVVWTMFDAAHDEAPSIIPLLSELFQQWPELDTEIIAGDSGWDEDPWCELAERHYGIHPIFRRHNGSAETRFAEKHKKLVEGKFISLGGDGRPRCIHNQLLDYETAELPRRDGLRPGKPHPNEKAFRVRFRCEHGNTPLGRPGLPMCVDWSRLTYYPHHSHGHPERYAMRVAMLRRLNQIESWHNHLEAGLRIATEGADRSRLGALAKQEALLTLAALTTTSLALADQRLNHGLDMPALPPRPSTPKSSNGHRPSGTAQPNPAADAEQTPQAGKPPTRRRYTNGNSGATDNRTLTTSTTGTHSIRISMTRSA